MQDDAWFSAKKIVFLEKFGSVAQGRKKEVGANELRTSCVPIALSIEIALAGVAIVVRNHNGLEVIVCR
jgi:hypothetical protein